MMQHEMGAATAAPTALSMGPPSVVRPSRRRLVAWAVFVAVACVVAAWGVSKSPRMAERRWFRMSLPELERERAGRLTDPNLLYFSGLRMNQQGRFAAADPILRNAVGLDPHSPRLRDEWAKALLGSG